MRPCLFILCFFIFFSCKKNTSAIITSAGFDQYSNNAVKHSSEIEVFLSADNPKEGETVYSGTTSKILAFSFQNNTGRDSSFDGLIIAFHGAVNSVEYVRLYNDDNIQIGYSGLIGDTAFLFSTSIGENKLKKGETKHYFLRIDLNENAAGIISADIVSYLSINNGNAIPAGLSGNQQVISQGAGIVNLLPGTKKTNVPLYAGKQLLFYDSVHTDKTAILASVTLHPSSGTITPNEIDSFVLICDGLVIAQGNWRIRKDITLGEQSVIHFFIKNPVQILPGWHKLKIAGIVLQKGNGIPFSLYINQGDILFNDDQGRTMRIYGLPSSSPDFRIKI